jgi:hypothetical protein
MSLNGSGVYNVNSAGQPVVANTLITSAAFNAFTADIAAALSTAVFKDGQQTITANLPMGGYRLTGLGAGSAAGQSLRYEQQFSVGANIASAATLDLNSATGQLVHITGTTPITAVTLGSGIWRLVIFDGALTLTHHATNNNLPGAANITTAAGDRALYWSDGTTVYCVFYQKVNGKSVVETPQITNGRLTLTSATPVTSGDVTGATTVYFTPYKGNVVALYDGNRFVATEFTELSQATSDTTKSPAAVANNSGYDIFVWNDGGTLRATRGPAWSSIAVGSSSRGTGAGTTELELLEGRYVNKFDITNGPLARRGLYVGSIKSDGSSQINDSQAIRNVWNQYNRTERPVKVTDTTDTWTYTTNTWRQANGNTANLVEYFCGFAEDAADITAAANAANSAAAVDFAVSVGLNSSTAKSADSYGGYGQSQSSDRIFFMTSRYTGIPPAGRNQFVWLETSSATGTTTWFGDGGVPNNMTNGLKGVVMA